MKIKTSCLLLIYICIASAGNTFAAKVEIKDSFRQGLIGHWTFDDLKEGVLRDSTEVGLDASVQGNVSLEQTGVALQGIASLHLAIVRH